MSVKLLLTMVAIAALTGLHADDRHAAMNRDKLGVFIHWGLYSVLGDGEWVMFQRKIPKVEYNRLADVFRQPKDFSPREWVRLAKRAGARYCVFTSRHHDGFALWDTKTTDFNSVKTAAGRDFVREFCEACREEGLRVGLYYSLMNWQHWNQYRPYDKSVWDEQVRVTVEGLRELMTDYGKIDYLWYDGCWGPGTSDVNGKEAVPFAEGFKPKAFPLHLKKGENEILLAFHCGMGSHFARFFDNIP